MAGKILSVEVGHSITHVIEIDYQAKSPKIYNAFLFETPPNVLSDEGIRIDEAMITRMKDGLAKNKIKTKRVMFTIASARIANREVTMPLVKDNKIKQVLLANSKDYFPVDLSQYELVYIVTDRFKAEKQMKLTVFAVPRTMIESYQQLAKAWNLDLACMDYSGNSMYQTGIRVSPDLCVLLRIGAGSSMITVVKNRKVDLQRLIGYGLDDAVEAVKNDYGFFDETASYLDAFDVMRKECCLNSYLNMEDAAEDENDYADEDVVKMRVSVTQAFTMLIGNLSRVLDYYLSRNQDIHVEQIHLTGIGAVCLGLDRLLTNELGIRTVPLADQKFVTLGKTLSPKTFRAAEYMPCIGSTFEPFNFMVETKTKKKAQSSSLGFSIVISALFALVGLALVALGLLNNMELQTEQIMLQNQVRQLEYIEDIIAENDRTRVDYEWTKNVREQVENENENFVAFIEELEKKMPTEIRVLALAASEESVSLNIEVGTKTEAANVIAALRKFESISLVPENISTFSDNEDEFGNMTVSFSVECKYIPRVEENNDSVQEGQP